jgi:hypothetical protein
MKIKMEGKAVYIFFVIVKIILAQLKITYESNCIELAIPKTRSAILIVEKILLFQKLQTAI